MAQPSRSALPLAATPEPVLPALSMPPLGLPEDHLPEAPQQGATHLVLRLGERRVYVYGGETVLDSYPVAIGAPATPTPVGEYQIFQMIVDPIWQSPWTGEIHEPGPNSALGLRWIGFLTLDNGIIGFHGTPTVSSIGQAASNGCVRLRNEDVVALFDQVHMGMSVIVTP
ncbi:L,D-transpeptidase [Leptolyngbya sp. BL0902]|uniref:L,D-transpeptidase n=1 Tax=Leptolyngbya sp. BL0902 TaxID=1115757 RepID=UPI001CED802C|nr:L,D-transpeptidase [Leptolyngbya sp. BL0902]